MLEINDAAFYSNKKTVGYVHDWLYPEGATYRICKTCNEHENMQ